MFIKIPSTKGLTISFCIWIAFVTSNAFANQVNTENFMQPGKVVGKHIFGLARDFQGDPLLVNESPVIYEGVKQHVDLLVEERKFVVSFFDSLYSGVYISEYDLENKSILNTTSLDLGVIKGVTGLGDIIHTPWNTILFSENNAVNSREYSEFQRQFAPYFKGQSESVDPYAYGWVNEVVVLDQSGKTKAISNYAVGRLMASDILMMPDQKTFYFYDGQHSGNLYLFVGEEQNSLAKGNLYVFDAKRGMIELGKSSALKVKFKLKKAAFDKVFKASEYTDSACKKGFTEIDTVYGKECLKINKKYKKYVGQLEPIRAAALAGTTSLGLGIEELKYNSHKNEIIVRQNGALRELSLGINESLGSQYIIK